MQLTESKLIEMTVETLEREERELAFTLYDVWIGKIYEIEGFKNFKSYLLSIGLKPKKAKYLIYAVKRYKELGIDAPTLSWKKFCIIASVLTIENKDDWLKKAKELNIEELCREVSNHKKKRKTDKKIRLTCQLTKEQDEIIQTAIDEAKHRLGVNTIGDCITQICYDWYQNLD